jgi:hypothetical protein
MKPSELPACAQARPLTRRTDGCWTEVLRKQEERTMAAKCAWGEFAFLNF